MAGALAGAVLAGTLLMVAAGWHYERRLEAQEHRNLLLATETAALESRIEEARGWLARREELLRRMEVVGRLRNSRLETARVFDALANTLVEGIHYGRLERRGQTMEVEGFAASNRLVSTLLRNLESTPRFTSARLKRLGEDPRADAYGPNGSVFEMTFLQAARLAPDTVGGEG